MDFTVIIAIVFVLIGLGYFLSRPKGKQIVEPSTNEPPNQDGDAEQAGLTSVKAKNFLNRPFDTLELTDLPGIGPEYAKTLKGKDVTPKFLLGKFLALERNGDAFMDWIKGVGGLTNPRAEQLFNGIATKWQRMAAM